MEQTFTTTNLGDIDLALINVLITQSYNDKEAVKRACKFVLERLENE